MNYNLNDIKLEIVSNIKYIFDASRIPNYRDFGTGFTFDKGLELFFQVLFFKTNINELDGLKTLIPVLHEAFITKKADKGPLEILSNNLEAYLKKISFVISNGSNNYTLDRSKNLMFVIKNLGLNPNNDDFSDRNLPILKGSDYFLEYVCKAYLIRNKFHNSPDLNLIEIVDYLQSTITTYLYATFKHFATLQVKVGNVHIPSQPHIENETPFSNPNTKAWYDFISFNDGTFQIKSQIVNSYILHFLSSKGKVDIDTIKIECNKQFQTNADVQFYQRAIQELQKVNKVVVSGVYNNEIELSSQESLRIIKVKENFYYQEQLFISEVNELLKQYNADSYTTDIIKKLTELFENNYNIDLQEIFDKGFEAKDNVVSLRECISYLATIVHTQEKAEELFGELIIVCSSNDFLHRVTAGQVFTRIVNPSEIENYLRLQERIIYLDTQVLLHALCYYLNYEDEEYNNVFYKATKDLIVFAENSKKIKLITSHLYVLEAAYHLKEALLLVPFEEIGLFERIGNSNNVFFKFYVYLKGYQKLEQNIENFADFLYGFELSEDNLYDKYFMTQTSSLITEFLNNVGIEVKTLPFYEKDDAFEVVKNSLTLAGKFRDSEPMKNDATMVCHLSNKDYHINEPTFSTWDISFSDIRKKFLTKYRNSKMWHLFTPSKLLNHLQLLEFKINSKSVTNEFLSIVDGVNIQSKTKNLLDIVNELFDIEKEERRKYISKFKEFNSKYVFNINQNTQEAEEANKEPKPVEKLIIELHKYYSDRRAKYNFGDFKNLFTKKEYFEKVIGTFQRELDIYSVENTFSDKLYSDIDLLILNAKQSVTGANKT